jgi:hypothetical protein
VALPERVAVAAQASPDPARARMDKVELLQMSAFASCRARVIDGRERHAIAARRSSKPWGEFAKPQWQAIA